MRSRKEKKWTTSTTRTSLNNSIKLPFKSIGARPIVEEGRVDTEAATADVG